MNGKNIIMLLGSIFLCLLAGGIGTIFTTSSIPTWYAGLHKAALNPPNWVFAPVWSTLYILMGISLFLVISKGLAVPGVKAAVICFAIQLILNTLWSIVFFGAKSTFAGIPVIVLLWFTILICIVMFFKISRTASILLIPYILWVSFATYLNISVYILNK